MKLLDANVAAAEQDKTPAKPDAVQKPEPPVAEDDEQSIIGTVVSEDDKPVAGFSVEITRQNGRREKTILTDDQGRFQTPMKYWTEPIYGNELFVAVANDQGGRLGWFEIPSSGAKRRLSNGTILPHPEPQPFTMKLLPLDRIVTGQVLGPNREPLENVRIQAVRLKSAINGDVNLYKFGLRTELPLPSAMTDEAGRFSIKLPKDVGVTLNALHPNWIVKSIPVADDNPGETASSQAPTRWKSGLRGFGETGGRHFNPCSLL